MNVKTYKADLWRDGEGYSVNDWYPLEDIDINHEDYTNWTNKELIKHLFFIGYFNVKHKATHIEVDESDDTQFHIHFYYPDDTEELFRFDFEYELDKENTL